MFQPGSSVATTVFSSRTPPAPLLLLAAKNLRPRYLPFITALPLWQFCARKNGVHWIQGREAVEAATRRGTRDDTRVLRVGYDGTATATLDTAEQEVFFFFLPGGPVAGERHMQAGGRRPDARCGQMPDFRGSQASWPRVLRTTTLPPGSRGYAWPTLPWFASCVHIPYVSARRPLYVCVVLWQRRETRDVRRRARATCVGRWRGKWRYESGHRAGPRHRIAGR